MTATERNLENLFKPELAKIRAEFGDATTAYVVSMLAEQIAVQAREYEAEARYYRQRTGRDPSYDVAIDFAAIRRDLRAAQRQRAIEDVARLRLIAQHN